ncbi:DDHD domain-containing protein [Pseudomassariella vexata]|uniref:DDHD domain-domain-containing protein n=1 Tax=Pseudomassariella vexata TaxID=1141098 RepID=A0A1Y2E1Q6_9PEZI|nr:DDHD domain-containing protein [Pseudomassariella vexata]ORY65284.1 DDHD domain-domain-containing protein [Pseudomassariella vexata]
MPSESGRRGAGPPSEKKVEKSYLASAVDSLNPWTTSRSISPAPKQKEMPPPSKPVPAPSKKADDHSINTLYGQSFKRYPADCPPLNVLWFHAVDVPKRKPQFLKGKREKEEQQKPVAPKKFVAFTTNDSRCIELAYQQLLEELEDARGRGPTRQNPRSSSQGGHAVVSEDAQSISLDQETVPRSDGVRVPVNEDFLFDVDIEQRELAPVYWLGPVYDVRRGSWFYQEGSALRPCEENLAAQIEEGYLKCRPWAYPAPRSRCNSGMAQDITPKASRDNLRAAAASQAESSSKPPPSPAGPQHQPLNYRLFGTYMNSTVTYSDATTAWLTSDSMLSWVTSTVYQRFAGGGYMSGVKLVRGYSEPGKTKEDKRPATPNMATMPTNQEAEDDPKALKWRSAPPLSRADSAASLQEEAASEMERQENRLKRQFSSYIENSDDPVKQEEQIRKREEQEIQDDYSAPAGETQGREIEHLVLVTHGIGQLLGLRMESLNFVHDVNVFRKTIKGVYTHSADLRALNAETGDSSNNCRVQVLPVCWRHLLDFPKRREKKAEHDLGTTFDDEDDYPSLEDITIEGMAFARSLISDLALDVLLYQSAYREQIAEIVLKESNRIYKLFTERNPEFKGKVHIVGHSLGSAIMFDILCRQKEKLKHAEQPRNPLRIWPANDRPESSKHPRELAFGFDVEDLYCLGSPIGLFQMLKGRTIGARHLHGAATESPLDSEYMDDPFSTATLDQRVSPITGLPFSISSPKVAQLFNIFHPSDPISYRMEPLISPAMASLKPQALPYTKKGIFNSVTPQGLSGIGVKVGQSVSGLWSSISGGIASSLLNRSLGLSNEDVANLTANSNSAAAASTPQPHSSSSTLSPGAGTNITGGGVIDLTLQSEKSAARKRVLARQNAAGSSSTQDPYNENATLIDEELETLYTRFQKKRVEEYKEAASRADEGQELGDAWAAEEQNAQKYRREELKVRALNRNGRVDYSIQESVLDFNPINTIASHMAYWQDEDVSHFVLSQLLANKSKSTTAHGQGKDVA